MSASLFVANEGQWADESVRYAFYGSGANVLHTDSGPVFQLFQREAGESDELDGNLDSFDPLGDSASPQDVVIRQTQFSVRFEGAQHVEPSGLHQAETVYNYFVGDESNWRERVPTYETVAYLDLYDGIDLYTWGRRNSLKYEFHVAPGHDYRQIQVSYDGTERLWLDDDGELHVTTELGELIDDAPYIYQVIDGQQVEVAGAFSLVDAATYTFEVTGSFDPTLELVIDPELAWASYLGGSDSDSASSLAVDASGNAYVTGGTISLDFPTPGGVDTGLNGGGESDAYVAKVTAAGSLAWASYLGGRDSDVPRDIAVDGRGDAVLTGWTRSDDFPVPGGLDTSKDGPSDGFVAKVTSTGSLVWATYLGGSEDEAGFSAGIAVDAADNVLVTGVTSSSDFPTPDGFDTSYNGGSDAFVAKLTPDGNLTWGTYLGGNRDFWNTPDRGAETGQSIAVDASGDVLVTGFTWSSDFPTPGGFDHTLGGKTDAFVAKFTGTGSLVWASYLGGSTTPDGGDLAREDGRGLAVDSSGNVLVTGYTQSRDFPIRDGFDTRLSSYQDAFVAKITGAGRLEWSSYLGGGSGNSDGHDIAVDASGDVLVTGRTSSANFPTPGGFDTSFNGERDAFVVRITSTCSLVWGSYLGGSESDEGIGIAVDSSGNALVMGETASSDFPTAGGFDTTYNGGRWGDAFVAKIRFVTRTLGDVNDDGQVNGLDVDPFVGVLLSGPYNAAADMNEDGVVNGLDVDPFVAAVVGGSGVAIERNDLGLQSTAEALQRSHESSAARLTARRSLVRYQFAQDPRRLGLNEIVGSLGRRMALRDWQATVDRAFGGDADWIGRTVR